MSNDINGSPSLLTAQGAGQDHLGIYIKSIVKGGPAERVRLFKCEAGMWRVGMKQNGSLEISTIKFSDDFSLQNGKFTAGDQLLSVDGHSLVGISQER